MSVVKATLTNRLAWITDSDDSDYKSLRDYWSFIPKGARFNPGFKLWLREKAKAEKEFKRTGVPVNEEELKGWDGKIKLFQRGHVPAGLFRATRDDAEKKLGINFKAEKDLPDVSKYLALGFDTAEAKYSYQNDCVKEMVHSLEYGGGIVLAATGVGKTKIAGQYASYLNCSILFVVDQIDLLYQSQKEIEFWLKEKVGVVGNSKYEIERVTVATIQTLHKHIKDPEFKKWYRKIKVVIVDELHEQLSRRNFKVLNVIKPIARYGLTATIQLGLKPVRMKAYSFAGPVIYKFPYSEGVHRGVVTNGKVLQLLFSQMYDAVVDSRGYQDQYKEEVIEHEVKEKAVLAIVTFLLDHGYYILIHVDRVAHIKRLHSVFSSIRHRLAYGAVGKEKRLQAVKMFERGKIRLVIANKVFRKGVDLKRVDVVIDMAEMKSKNSPQQKFGRGVRLHKDKDLLLYVDFGTVDGRFSKAAKARARALKSLGIQLTKKEVHGPIGTLKAIRKFLVSDTTLPSKQMKLKLT